MSTKIRNPWQKVIALTLILIFVMMITLPAGAQDGVVETTPLTDPPTPDPDQQQVEQGPARNVSHFPEDFESYIPMPLPAHSEVKSVLSESSFVSFDMLTGEETISEVEFTPDQLMMAVEGSEGGSAEEEPRTPLNFSALSWVANPEDYPYRRSVKMFFRQGGIGYVCSGTLIDPLHVITAGHCVHEGSGGSWSSNVVIAPAYENGSRPFGDAAAAQLHSWTGWTVSGDWDDDIGIIDLDRPVGALTGWHGYGYSNDCSYFTSVTWHHDGYPAASPYNGQYMYTQSGDFDACETSGGVWYGNEVSFNRLSQTIRLQLLILFPSM
jgi:V8-like Glu-specific endopeptidase